MSGEYAKATDVPVSRSRDEIERTLSRFGATAFAYYADAGGRVAIQFEVNRLRVLMRMTLPDREPFRRDSRGRLRAESAVEKDWEQACRQRWRSLANGIKAKLALIDDGISTVEQEFLSNLVLPGGATVGERVIPDLAAVVETGDLPPLVPGIAPPAKVIELPARAGTGGAR
jgi:hypothetical protein